MEQKEYDALLEEVLAQVKAKVAIVYWDDQALVNDIEDTTLLQFKSLPIHTETIKTLKGIKGFSEYLKHRGLKELDDIGFVTNSLHDLDACRKDGLQPWFSPRLSRFVDYKGEEAAK